LLKVGEGGSLEGAVKKHLKATGLKEGEAGIKAGLMADEFARSHDLADGPYSLIHPGATIEIADGKIINISGDDRLGYLRQDAKKVAEKIKEIKKNQYEKNPLIADKSAQELIKMKNSIFSKYKGEISSDKDIYNQAKKLQEKSDGLGLSFLSQSEQEQLNVLNEYKRGIQKTFRQMMTGFLNTKDDKILKMDAIAYLANSGNGGAAGTFEELKRTIVPEEIEKYNLNPNQSDRVIDWSRRVVTYMLKKQIETKS
jgi:hypothetical protein